ncbi:MAG: glycoside hydrolase family 3 N-terminal domain-containing protein [Anaerolineae bacterium]|jgi:beta-N-acetylhexosaminidase
MAVWLLILVSLLVPLAPAHAQETQPDLDARVENLLASMTVEERVGQLFLVTFVGKETGPESDVAQLVRQDRVGGVVLLASNANFANGPDTPKQVAGLANALQSLAMADGPQVPLFIAVDHEGDGYPYTRIRGGTTPLPNAMAIGATWDTGNAREVGRITGLELAAMGINLLLGPSVDVLSTPRPGGQGDIGTRAFGGDPWWVGEMGQAYIEGVHEGGGGRVATVAKHFPGHGGSDRLPDEEVATVDKSIEELKRVELAPFLAVTGDADRPEAVSDALMSSHIRYRGFQRNVRQFTAPISFDPEGMEAILALEGFAAWRPTGLMVSDSLGVPAVRRYFDPTLETFPHRRIAKEAFLAGNDLLLLAQFDLNDIWADQLRNIRDAIDFFREEYRRDPAFAGRVDEAVARILRLKLSLYPEFQLDAVQVYPEAALQVCGLGGEVTQHIADQALTLLYPDPNAMPEPPRPGDKILVFTDARPVRECYTTQCQAFAPLSQTAVEEAILRSFGPQGTGQVDPADITSLTFGQLKAFLAGDQVEPDIGSLLAQADWLILAQQDLNPVKGPNSDAVELFLDSPLSTASEARLVVLAFNAPYYLDTTEISKLDLYLGVYAKSEPFVRTAVRALFGELIPQGASPVDVQGINYDLDRQLAPDPSQTLPLVRVQPSSGGPVAPPVEVRLLAGPVLDHNGNPVPDGTRVTFYAEYEDGGYVPPATAEARAGYAEGAFTLERGGRVQCRAESGEADQSQVVSLAVQVAASATPPATESPTASPTQPSATPRPTPTAAPEETVSPPATTGPRPPAAGSLRPVDGADLGLAGICVLVAAAAGVPLLGRRRRRSLVRWVLLAVIGGMAGYVLYALQVVRPEVWGLLPQGAWSERAAVAIVAAVASLLPLPLVIGRGETGK